MSMIPLFCESDDFCLKFSPTFNQRRLEERPLKRHRKSQLCLSEVMTIIVWFHPKNSRTFKHDDTKHVCVYLRWAFPNRVSYNRFVELMADALKTGCAYLMTRKGRCSGISLIDSIPIAVGHHRRIHSNRVFAETAFRGKNSVGWFYGFKLHLGVNDRGELLAIQLTPGNVDDRTPVPKRVKALFGKLFGDQGSLSQERFDLLFEPGIQLVTKLRKNMKNMLMPLIDKRLLRKRAIIEMIGDPLKNICHIEHTRHRSGIHFWVNVISALIAYTYQEKKPSLNLRADQLSDLPAVII